MLHEKLDHKNPVYSGIHTKSHNDTLKRKNEVNNSQGHQLPQTSEGGAITIDPQAPKMTMADYHRKYFKAYYNRYYKK
jgi:hypothetical protein